MSLSKAGIDLYLEFSVLCSSHFGAHCPGFRRYTDRLDGFTLLVPDYWVQVRGSGAEVQFRSPQNGDENLFVAVSSPSSSKYTGVKDLGSPEESGKFIKKQYVAEYMSTRLGVRRTAEVVSASSREVEVRWRKSLTIFCLFPFPVVALGLYAAFVVVIFAVSSSLCTSLSFCPSLFCLRTCVVFAASSTAYSDACKSITERLFMYYTLYRSS